MDTVQRGALQIMCQYLHSFIIQYPDEQWTQSRGAPSRLCVSIYTLLLYNIQMSSGHSPEGCPNEPNFRSPQILIIR